MPRASASIARTARAAGARTLATLLAGLAAVLAAVGCGAQEESTVPVACKAGPDAVGRALADAPEPVRVHGIPLSECLSAASDQADLQAVGSAFVESASDLAPEARADPESAEALRLGYLVGAARRGAVPGIHEELVRRLEQELTGVDTSSKAFERGERAGRISG
jgi:hypothetical protein